MGATSTTGVGSGSAEKYNKNGPGNARDAWVPKLSPHILWCGYATLSGGVATVQVPTAAQLPASQIAILVTPNLKHATAVTAKTEAGGLGTGMTSFDLGGTLTDVVDFVLINKGLA